MNALEFALVPSQIFLNSWQVYDAYTNGDTNQFTSAIASAFGNLGFMMFKHMAGQGVIKVSARLVPLAGWAILAGDVTVIIMNNNIDKAIASSEEKGLQVECDNLFKRKQQLEERLHASINH